MGLDTQLEVRLMHEWTAYTCQSFSTAWEFWRFQAPLIAMEHRHLIDAMFGLAALHASRQSPSQWIPVQGRMVPIRDPRRHETAWNVDNNSAGSCRSSDATAYLAATRSRDMLVHARMYFDRAIDGHRYGLAMLTEQNIEALYMTSVLCSFHALFTLSESEDDSTLPCVNPIQWLRLADGTRILCDKWREFVGDDWMKHSGVFYGRADLADEEELFLMEHGRPFEKLLTWAEEYESLEVDDRDTYKKCLSCIGLSYKNITEDKESALASCRRLVALPSQLPRRFTELVELRAPRALVMLAHIFAIMKLISDRVGWFRGIAERQIPKIDSVVPTGWKELMKWPILVAEGRINLNSYEDDVREFLSF